MICEQKHFPDKTGLTGLILRGAALASRIFSHPETYPVSELFYVNTRQVAPSYGALRHDLLKTFR